MKDEVKNEVQKILRDAYTETTKWLEFIENALEESNRQFDELVDVNEELLRENFKLKDEIKMLEEEIDGLINDVPKPTKAKEPDGSFEFIQCPWCNFIHLELTDKCSACGYEGKEPC